MELFEIAEEQHAGAATDVGALMLAEGTEDMVMKQGQVSFAYIECFFSQGHQKKKVFRIPLEFCFLVLGWKEALKEY